MKKFNSLIVALILVFDLESQEYYLQSGNIYVVVNQDKSINLDLQSASRLYVDKRSESLYLIKSKLYNFYLTEDLNQPNQINFSDDIKYASYFNLEWNPNYKGWLIIKQFSNGRFYLVLSEGRLRWHSNHAAYSPIILKEVIGQKETMRQEEVWGQEQAQRQEQARKQEQAQRQEQARRQEQAQRQKEAPKKEVRNGKLSINLSGINDCSKYKIDIRPDWHNNYSGPSTKVVGSDCKVEFIHLGDGDYIIELYILTNKESGDYSKCDGCGGKKVSYERKVNINNGNMKRVTINFR